MDSLVKTLVDNSLKTLKYLEEEIFFNDKILNIVNGIKKLFKEDKYKRDSIKRLNTGIPDKTDKLEGTLLVCMGENDLESLKTVFSDNRCKFLTKSLAYP